MNVATDRANLHAVYLPVYEVRRIQRIIGRRAKSHGSTRVQRKNAMNLIAWINRVIGDKREIEEAEMRAPELTWRTLGKALAESGGSDLTATIFQQIADVD